MTSWAAWACGCRVRRSSCDPSRVRERRRRADDEKEEAGEQLRRPPCLRDSVPALAKSKVERSRLCRRLPVGLSVLAWWCECEGCATTTTRA